MVLFGSRATKRATAVSDIDIGIISENPNIDKLLALLRQEIENSNISYKIDIVNLSAVSEKFRKKVLEEAIILWKS